MSVLSERFQAASEPLKLVSSELSSESLRKIVMAVCAAGILMTLVLGFNNGLFNALRGVPQQFDIGNYGLSTFTVVALSLLVLFAYRRMGTARVHARLLVLVGVSAYLGFVMLNGTPPLVLISSGLLLVTLMVAGPRFALLAGGLFILGTFVAAHYLTAGLHDHAVNARVYMTMLILWVPLVNLLNDQHPVHTRLLQSVKTTVLASATVTLGLWLLDPVWGLNSFFSAALSFAIWLWIRRAMALNRLHRFLLVAAPTLAYFIHLQAANGMTLFVLPGYVLFLFLCLPRIYAIAASVGYLFLGAAFFEITNPLVIRSILGTAIFTYLLTLLFAGLVSEQQQQQQQQQHSTTLRSLLIAFSSSVLILLIGYLPLNAAVDTNVEVELEPLVSMGLVVLSLLAWLIFELAQHISQTESDRELALARAEKALAEGRTYQRSLADKARELEVALKAAGISLFEVDTERGTGRLVHGRHVALGEQAVFNIDERLTDVLVDPCDKSRVLDAVASNNAEALYRVRFSPDEEPRWLHLHTSEQFDRAGRPLRLVVHHDVTEFKRGEQALKESAEKQKEMFAIIGHELRTPVAAITMISKDSDLSEAERLASVSELAENLLGVLEDLRTVVAPDRILESQASAVNPYSTVKRVLHSLTPLAQSHSFKLELKQDIHEEHFMLNEQALRQLSTNLVKNAILHSSGAMVRVSFECIRSDDTRVTAQLRVEDDGRGIAQEYRSRMYEAFSRGDSQHEGTGLGLYIALELAKTLGGELNYSDSALGGACFTVIFPVSEVSEAAHSNDTTPAQYDFSGMRIMLAEDDGMLRMLTQKSLSKQGAHVCAFVNGQMALDAYQEGEFDLILTDLMMPELDGHGLTRALRERGCTLPIIGVTAAVIGTETDQLLAEGADGFISKPINIEKLSAELLRIEVERVSA